MKYDNKKILDMHQSQQAFKARFKYATTNPNFTIDSGNRVSFFNSKYHDKKVKLNKKWTKEQTIKDLKLKWHKKHFTKEWVKESSFSESSVLNGSLICIKDKSITYEEYRNMSYIFVEIDGVAKYYFVDGVSFAPTNIINFTLSLDSITTYLDALKFGGFSKIHRKHYDRWNLNDKKDKIIMNFDEDSGIWNDDGEVKNSTFILDKVILVNNDDKEEIQYNSPLIKDKNKKNWFNYPQIYAYAFSKVNIEEKGELENFGRGSGYLNINKESDTSAGLPDRTSPILGQNIVKITNKDEILTALFNDGPPWEKTRQTEFYTMSLNTLRKSSNSSFIKSVVYSPIPLLKMRKMKDAFQQEGYYFQGLVCVDNNMVNYQNLKMRNLYFSINGYQYTGWEKDDVSPSGIIHETPWDNTRTSTIKIKDIVDNHILVSTLNKDRNFELETKLFTSQHMKMELNALNQQRTDLINEFIFNDEELILKVNVSIDNNESIIFTELINTYYNKYNKNNEKIFTASYKGQVPNPSSAYSDFLAGSLNSYKTSLAQNRVNMGVDAAKNLLTGHFFKYGTSILHGIQKENAMKAKVKDIKNLGSSTEINDVSLLKDIYGIWKGEFGNLASNITISKHPKINQREISDHYNKRGYISDRIEQIKEYSELSTRALFSHWEISKFEKIINKSFLSNEIIEDMNTYFSKGLTLWNVLNDKGETSINDYSKENWENNIYKLIK